MECSQPPSCAAISICAAANQAAVAPAEAAAIPTVAKTVAVDPTPGYIEMASNGRYALIAHRTQMELSVFDTALGAVTTTTPTPQGPPRFVTFYPTAEDRAAGCSGDRAKISTGCQRRRRVLPEGRLARPGPLV